VVLSLALLVSDRLRPEDRATGSPYVTFLAKQLPAGKQDRCFTPASHHLTTLVHPAGAGQLAARGRA